MVLFGTEKGMQKRFYQNNEQKVGLVNLSSTKLLCEMKLEENDDAKTKRKSKRS